MARLEWAVAVHRTLQNEVVRLVRFGSVRFGRPLASSLWHQAVSVAIDKGRAHAGASVRSYQKCYAACYVQSAKLDIRFLVSL